MRSAASQAEPRRKLAAREDRGAGPGIITPAIQKCILPESETGNGRRWIRRRTHVRCGCRAAGQRRRSLVRRGRWQRGGQQILFFRRLLQWFEAAAIPTVRIGVNGLAAGKLQRSDSEQECRKSEGRAGHAREVYGTARAAVNSDSAEIVTESEGSARSGGRPGLPSLLRW
jgi:hypothetical protein